MKIKRQQPLFFVHQSLYNQLVLKNRSTRPKLLCLETNRGRSINRTTRLSRSQHRLKLQNLLVYGFKPRPMVVYGKNFILYNHSSSAGAKKLVLLQLSGVRFSYILV